MFLVQHDSGVKLELFFYSLLEPYKHYIPTDVKGLEASVQWCVAHDAACEEIAEQAYKLTTKMLNPDFLTDYTTAVLRKAYEQTVVFETDKL